MYRIIFLFITSNILLTVFLSFQTAEAAVDCHKRLATRWTDAVNPMHVHEEYPRPQMVRPHWKSLNGTWNYAITEEPNQPPTAYDGKILVPFPLESALSGVCKTLRSDQVLWYERTVTGDKLANNHRTLLHFGAVDYDTTVYLNGITVDRHVGGYQSFTVDITDHLHGGSNSLLVRVIDPTDSGSNPHGKQSTHPMLTRYTPTSGIWQTVWLEYVPKTYIQSLRVTPNVDHSTVQIQVSLERADPTDEITVEVKDGARLIARATGPQENEVPIKRPHLWSPDDPFLYALEVTLRRSDRILDKVTSYFGMRKIEIKRSDTNSAQIFLNGKYTYNLGVLDQGFWPDGLYTAPSDAALAFDVRAAKAMGFNTIRMHLKVETERWYYYCDKLGMLVWQDMVDPADGSDSSRKEFEREVEENIQKLRNHPSIVTWVLFNELFGDPYDEQRIGQWVRNLDSTRLIDVHSGPLPAVERGELEKNLLEIRILRPTKALMKGLNGDREALNQALREIPPSDTAADRNSIAKISDTDMVDLHSYPGPDMPPKQDGKAKVLGEWGGKDLFVDTHVWNEFELGWSYTPTAASSLLTAFRDGYQKLKQLQSDGLTGSIYTQLYDVEGEENGLLTYDRKVAKIPISEIETINSTVLQAHRPKRVRDENLNVRGPNLLSEEARYASLMSDFRRGWQSIQDLQRLTLLAVRHGDTTRVSEFAEAYIRKLHNPLGEEEWRTLLGATQKSTDPGFMLLRSDAAHVDAVLGGYAAEDKIRDIIAKEEISPFVDHNGAVPDWNLIEKRVSEKYGSLGLEELYGAKMLYYYDRQDWNKFGTNFEHYFDSALHRSEYPLNNLAYTVFEHVKDPKVLQLAVNVERLSLDESHNSKNWLELFGVDDVSEIDTYAGLLYKLGRTREAWEWEDKAAKDDGAAAREILGHLSNMRCAWEVRPGAMIGTASP